MVLPCHLRPAQTDAYDAIEIGNSLIDAIVLSPPFRLSRGSIQDASNF